MKFEGTLPVVRNRCFCSKNIFMHFIFKPIYLTRDDVVPLVTKFRQQLVIKP